MCLFSISRPLCSHFNFNYKQQVFDLALNPLKVQLKSEKEKGSNTLNMASLFR